MRAGGGIGYDFSSVLPAESVRPDSSVAPGVVALMNLWNTMCDDACETASRRGCCGGRSRGPHTSARNPACFSSIA